MRKEVYSEGLSDIVSRLSAVLPKDGIPQIPVSILATKLSPAEAVVKYLRLQHGMRYSEIARLLNRDQRGIWCTFRRAQEKHPSSLPALASSYVIPASLFRDRALSILEHAVHHLRSQNVSVKEIARLINKHPSTVASVHHRVRRKLK